MIIQYIDTISFVSAGTPAVYDPNTGDYTPETPGSTVESKCRYEAASGNGWISTEGGERINYSGIIYLPKDAPQINTGTPITVTINRNGVTDQIIKDKVLRYFRGQLNARIWV